MTVTYPYGYAGKFKTRAEMEKQSAFMLIDPEMRRRVFAIMDLAKAKNVALGVGGAGRTDPQQFSLFHSRYDPCGPPCDARYLGVCYCKQDDVAAAAPPGVSYHQQTTPQGFALALDMIGDMKWMGVQLPRFGLYTFKAEPWHIQPIEVPATRRDYIPTKHALKVFTLPGNQPQQPMPPTPKPPMVAHPALRKGARGIEVQYAQVILRHAAGQVLIAPDGQYGSITDTGVDNVKMMFAIKGEVGIGPKTWAALELIANQPPVAVNA